MGFKPIEESATNGVLGITTMAEQGSMMSNSEWFEARDTLAESFAPEAAEFAAMLTTGVQSTENGYDRLMALLSGLPNMLVRSAFLEAMVEAGYPAHTAAFLRQQYNLPGVTDSQAVLMGLA